MPSFVYDWHMKDGEWKSNKHGRSAHAWRVCMGLQNALAAEAMYDYFPIALARSGGGHPVRFNPGCSCKRALLAGSGLDGFAPFPEQQAP